METLRIDKAFGPCREAEPDENRGCPTPEELEAVNRYSRRRLSADEVYVFSVILCDNEIDRDFERFTIEALHGLAKLFLGKTGIFDHSLKGRDQLARIFACEVEAVPGRTTAAGEPYHRLKARAYLPRIAKNEDLIFEIDAGIKKEVSVGCSVRSSVCSVCGAAKTVGCSHVPGREYEVGGRRVLCHTRLDDPHDAYEWSFVAVPAQRDAGVVKSHDPRGAKPAAAQSRGAEYPFPAADPGAVRPRRSEKGEAPGGEIAQKLPAGLKKSLAAGRLSQSDAALLLRWIGEAEAAAENGRRYAEFLKAETKKWACICCPDLTESAADVMLGRLSVPELEALCASWRKAAGTLVPCAVQLETKAETPSADGNRNFVI